MTKKLSACNLCNLSFQDNVYSNAKINTAELMRDCRIRSLFALYKNAQ